MSAPKHTPGPWQFFPASGHVIGGDMRGVAHVTTIRPPNPSQPVETERATANGHLIAAAPDGFEAAEDVIVAIDECVLEMSRNGDSIRVRDLADAARTKLREFVAKARGTP